jgi:hypothetical protein
VSNNLSDALTYEILTDDKETVLSRSVVRTAEEKMKQNPWVGFNHNLDPAIRLNPETHHADMPLETSLTKTKVKTKAKRRYKIKDKATKPGTAQQQQPPSVSTTTAEVTPAAIGETVNTAVPADGLRRSSLT